MPNTTHHRSARPPACSRQAGGQDRQFFLSSCLYLGTKIFLSTTRIVEMQIFSLSLAHLSTCVGCFPEVEVRGGTEERARRVGDRGQDEWVTRAEEASDVGEQARV